MHPPPPPIPSFHDATALTTVCRYPIAGYAMSHVVDPFKKDQFEGAVPTVFAVTMADAGGQYLCAPATPERASELAQSDELMENLMNLTRNVVSEKTGGEAVVAV